MNQSNKNSTGLFELNRKERSFKAGYCILKESLNGLKNHNSLLHADEKAFALGLKYDKRRHSYLLGRTCAKYALGEVLSRQTPASVAIASGVFQFPVVKHLNDQNLQVSISHCEDIGLALCYPEEHPMGIDIEKVEDKIVETLETQITASEKLLLKNEALDSDQGHTLLWTMKEALSKVFKTGLMMNFKSIQIEALSKQGEVVTGTYTHCAQYKTWSFLGEEYVCTIVIPKNTTVHLDQYLEQLKLTLNG